MAQSDKNFVIPSGSLILVSGANGYIASHVCDQLLKHRYKVRGTVRSVKRSGWIEKFFQDKYNASNFSLVEVPDMAVEGAFDTAVVGCTGFAHVATPVMTEVDPNIAVTTTVKGIVNALSAAAKEKGLTRVVMTSSSTAASNPIPNKEFSIDSNTWNEEAVKAAWAPPPYEGLDRIQNVYAASKTQSEQAAWDFMREKKPNFVLNGVLPNANFGKILSVEHQGYPTTAGWIKALWGNDYESLKGIPPQYYVNVQDNALLHVAALLFPDVKNERLFAFAHAYNWNDILAVLRKLYPHKKFLDDIPNLSKDLSKVSNERAEELLDRLGRPGWTSLEESVKDNVETLV